MSYDSSTDVYKAVEMLWQDDLTFTLPHETCGHGACAKVYKITLASGETVAVKLINEHMGTGRVKELLLRRERDGKYSNLQREVMCMAKTMELQERSNLCT
jgi:hypothetical protein